MLFLLVLLIVTARSDDETADGGSTTNSRSRTISSRSAIRIGSDPARVHNNNNNNNNDGGGSSGDNDSRLDRRDGISLSFFFLLHFAASQPFALTLAFSVLSLSLDLPRRTERSVSSFRFLSFLSHRVSPSFFHSLHSVHPSRHSPPAPGIRALNTGERETRRRTHAHALHLPRPRRLIRLRICDVKSSCVGSRCAPVTASASDGTACALGAPPSDHPTIIFGIHHHHPTLPPPPPPAPSPPPPPALLPPPSRHRRRHHYYHYYTTTTTTTTTITD